MPKLKFPLNLILHKKCILILENLELDLYRLPMQQHKVMLH